MSETIRPHEQQSPLERALRAELWKPQHILDEGPKRLKKLVTKKEYRKASELQTLMAKAVFEAQSFEHLLDLYEAEFRAKKEAT